MSLLLKGCINILEKLHSALKTMANLVINGDGAQAMQKEQQRGMDVVEQVPRLVTFRTQGEADFCGPANKERQETNVLVAV